MGTGKDKEKKQLEKLEKKRLKQQYKLEKKGKSTQQESFVETSTKGYDKSLVKTKPDSTQVEPEVVKVPWYKNPDWIRAIAAIVSLLVAIIAIIISLD
jgi:hypothetical protein